MCRWRWSCATASSCSATAKRSSMAPETNSAATPSTNLEKCMSESQALPDRYVLTGCAVLAGDDLDYLEDGHVVVEGGTITAVGRGSGLADVERIELPGRTIVPAFLNGHTHLGDSSLKELGFGSPPGTNLLWHPDGLRFQHMQEMDRDDRVASMRNGVLQMISSGTVLFADFREGGADGVRELREASAGLPITPLIFGRLATNPVFSPDEFAANTASLPNEGVSEIEEILDVADGYSPVWANELTDPALSEAAQMSRDASKRLATHAGETPLYRSLSLGRTGHTDVERIAQHVHPDFVVHMTSATNADIDTTVDAGLPIIMCPRSQEGLGAGLPPMVAALRAGASVGFGTDNVMLTSPEVLAEAQYYLFASRGRTGDTAVVTADQLLRSLTIETARALGVEDTFGSITPGKGAHLVCFDMRHPNLKNSMDPVATIVSRATAGDIEATLYQGQVAAGVLPIEARP
ncbi:MAG: amidohydrolase family protein [Acidimicrobiia bacterium]|nr:amidohydrolase family protein [Acidimicrobiia bacterium]